MKQFKKRKLGIYFLIASMLMVVACGQSSKPDESNWAKGQGDLPSSIGNKNGLKVNKLLQQGLYTEDFELWEKLEFYAPTGKWFFHNGEGLFGYGLTTGTNESGGEVFVSLIGHNENGEQLDRDVRVQLTEVHGSLDDKELILEETVHVDTVGSNEVIFTSTLPEKENTTYVLSAEILNEQGEAEDTRVSTIYVPRQEINAALSLDKNAYKKDETEAKLTLTNYGPTFLTLGKGYSIEKKVKDEWRVVPLDMAFEAIAIIMSVGDHFEQTVDISTLDEGKYRVIKSMNAEGFDLRTTLAVEFTIE